MSEVYAGTQHRAVACIANMSNVRVIFVLICAGLDAAGKTTILFYMKLGAVLTTIPTIGFNVETIKHKRLTFTAWDVGGGDKIVCSLIFLLVDFLNILAPYSRLVNDSYKVYWGNVSPTCVEYFGLWRPRNGRTKTLLMVLSKTAWHSVWWEVTQWNLFDRIIEISGLLDELIIALIWSGMYVGMRFVTSIFTCEERMCCRLLENDPPPPPRLDVGPFLDTVGRTTTSLVGWKSALTLRRPHDEDSRMQNILNGIIRLGCMQSQKSVGASAWRRRLLIWKNFRWNTPRSCANKGRAPYSRGK